MLFFGVNIERKKSFSCVDDEVESGFTIKDYNFDGYQNIAIYNALVMINNIYHAFLYYYKKRVLGN